MWQSSPVALTSAHRHRRRGGGGRVRGVYFRAAFSNRRRVQTAALPALAGAVATGAVVAGGGSKV
jgi:hypothetical protein